MKKQIIRLTEEDLHNIISESVKKVITELDWKTYMNASKGRKKQADDIRDMYSKSFPNSDLANGRNPYDDKADKLEKYAQSAFQKQHGRDGNSFQYDDELTDYRGGWEDSDDKFKNKAKEKDSWIDDEPAKERNYRYGNGFPERNGGTLHDDTFDYHYTPNHGVTGSRYRRHAERFDKDGRHYDPYMSTVGDEVSQSKNKDYNNALENMANDMTDYYTGKSKYVKGKGWK